MYTNFLTLESISLISTIMVNLVLIIIMLLIKNKTKNSYYFLGFILGIFAWTSSTLVFLISSGEVLLWSAKLFYISGCIIPVFIILFTKTLAKEKLNYSALKKSLLFIFPTFVCASVLIPGFVVKDVVIEGNIRSIIFGPMYNALFLYIAVYFSIAFILMFNKFTKLKGNERNQVEIIFPSIMFASISALGVSLVMPTFGNFTLFWAGPFFSGYTLLTIAYGIIRYGLFDIKLVATEFITLTTWMLLVFKILFDKTPFDRTIDGIILTLIVISGVLVIKAVKKETYLREKDDELVVQLQALDKKKSEFMSLATHQLRTPLTAMKGYSSMILDGTFGKVNNPEVEDAVNKISRSTTDLTMIVEDYLNISQIEQGRMQYNFSTFDVVGLIKNIMSDVKNSVDRAGLTLDLTYPENVEYTISADKGKIKQVFLNVVDNAIKYTPQGAITISLVKDNDKILVIVADTGVGINPEILPTLFNKYVRAPDASQINILGTGLGLYVAGEILKAHKGRAWGESEGEGKGSRFFIELPAA